MPAYRRRPKTAAQRIGPLVLPQPARFNKPWRAISMAVAFE